MEVILHGIRRHWRGSHAKAGSVRHLHPPFGGFLGRAFFLRSSAGGVCCVCRLAGLDCRESLYRPIQGRRTRAGFSKDGWAQAQLLRGRRAAQREDPLRPVRATIVAAQLPAGQQGLSLLPVPGYWWGPTTVRLSDRCVGYRVDDLAAAFGHTQRGAAGSQAAATDGGASRL
jgi:hypothetical protein